jgi:RHS repeat-associated protein
VNVGVSTVTSTTMTYEATDRDRICRIAFGNDSGTACNVTYDELGSITTQPTPTGTRQYSYLVDGSVRTIRDDTGSRADFQYDAFGQVQRLDVTRTASLDTRQDRHYGSLLTSHVEGGTPVLTRTIPGPEGFIATRHGPGGRWVFAFGEQRGNRFFTDENGVFVQDVDYQPFGEATSTGAQPGSEGYSNKQWNFGDALAAFGISQLGARLYDPAVGRFLSRDPLFMARTASTSNPYAFASNDPINGSDPTGLAENRCDDAGTNCDEAPPEQRGHEIIYVYDPYEPLTEPTQRGQVDEVPTVANHNGEKASRYESKQPRNKAMPPPVFGGSVPAGPWVNPPGGQPVPFFLGQEAHRGIAAYYAAHHPRQVVLSNFHSIGSILATLRDAGIESVMAGLGRKEDLRLMPDITNLTLMHLYEIKPWRQLVQGLGKAQTYTAIFWSVGVPMERGPSDDPGTAGVIPAPGGHFQFWSPTAGVILWRYKRGDFVPLLEPKPQKQEATEPVARRAERASRWVALGVAAYWIISESSRVLFPPRNLIFFLP